MNIKKILLEFCILILISTLVGCVGEESTSSRPPDDQFIVSEENLADQNYKISKTDISINLVKEKINIAYDHLSVEITNNSQYPLTWNLQYNIYEDINGKFFLLDGDGDALFEVGDVGDRINSGETVQRRIYLAQIRDDDYTRVGKYKIELIINEENKIPLEFEVVDDYIFLDTGISIQADKEQYSINDNQEFSYTVINNSQEVLNITLDVMISRYQNGKWVRLPFTEKYREIHYNASLWSESCKAGSKIKEQFKLSLSNMIDTELTPGRYRLEKEIFFDWYFAEFIVI